LIRALQKGFPMSRKQVTSTDCIHAGRIKHPETSSITPPIVHSAPFTFHSIRELLDFMDGRSDRKQPEYGRMGNPTVMAVEKRLAALDGAEQALLFASGMAAVTSLFITLLEGGDHLILTSDSYRRTRDFGFFLAKFGVEMEVVDPSAEGIERALRPETRLIFTEIPTNPYLRFVDFPRVAEITRNSRALLVADSTFATPVNFRPLEAGADLVIHSATKYLGGHNDLIAGVLAGRNELLDPIREMLHTLGGICDPNTAFLLYRGLKTLAVRVARHNENGMKVAEFLENQSKIERVYYPGLESHPDHKIASALMRGFGGVVTFLVKGDFETTARFIDGLEIPLIAPSLGGVETLVDPPALMSFWNLSPEERTALGIPDNLVRLATGIEDTEDLIADLDQSLKRL